MDKLIPAFETTDPSTLDDLMLCIARTIEDSLFQAGAIPGKDYTRLDLYKLAQPFALHIFKIRKGEDSIAFTVGWPFLEK